MLEIRNKKTARQCFGLKKSLRYVSKLTLQ